MDLPGLFHRPDPLVFHETFPRVPHLHLCSKMRNMQNSMFSERCFSRQKIPKRLCYPIKRNELEAVLSEFSEDLFFSIPRRNFDGIPHIARMEMGNEVFSPIELCRRKLQTARRLANGRQRLCSTQERKDNPGNGNERNGTFRNGHVFQESASRITHVARSKPLLVRILTGNGKIRIEGR
jgi:hypothetical protein